MTRIASIIVVAVIAACSSSSTDGTTGAPDPKGDVIATKPTLAVTHWTLVAIGSSVLGAGATEREAFITLDSAGQQLNGSNGCNIVFARYAVRGDAIGFTGIGATKMACPKGMEIESAFHDALARTARFHIANQQLELVDAGGATTARFSASLTK